jgi:outer membrane protein assembly factor BamB
MHKAQSFVPWVLLAILGLCVLGVFFVVGVLFLSYKQPSSARYPPELLDGNEDHLANIDVVGLSLSPIWEYQASSPIDCPPIYRANHVILKGGNHLWSVNPSLGYEEWRYEDPHYIYTSFGDGVVVLDKVIVFQTDTISELHAVDLETGQYLWETPWPVRGFISDGKSRLFVARAEGLVAVEYQALDAASGRVIWVSEVRPDGRGGWSLYDSSRREVYVRDDDFQWMVLNDGNGQVQKQLGDKLSSADDPILANNGILYIEKYCPRSLLAMDAREGKTLWAQDHPTLNNEFKPTVYKNILYTRTSQQILLAINLRTGDIQWQYPADSDPTTSVKLLSKPVVLDGVVYGIFSDARLRGFNVTTGQEMGYIQFANVPDVSRNLTVPGLAASHQMLYVSLGKTRLYAFLAVR